MFDQIFKPLLAAALLALLGACAGTGTTNVTEINSLIRSADGNTGIVARNTGFAGSGPRIFVLMDGTQVAALGNNEVGTFQATPGTHTLSIQFEGPAIGLKTNTLTYVNDPKRPQFFVITLTQNLFGAEMTISEVSANSFPSAIN